MITGLIDRIADQAARRGEAIAVEDGAELLSYAGLMARTRTLCARLGEVDRSAPVGVLMQPSADYVVAVLALLMSGHISVPLNDRHPLERLRRIASRAGLGAVIANDATAAAGLGARLVVIPVIGAPAPPAEATQSFPPERIVTLSFSSGSTGEPKGISRSERAELERLRTFVPSRPLTSEDRVPILEALSVGMSISLMLCVLTAGGRLGLIEMSRLGVAATIERLQRFRPTVYNVVASTFQTLFGVPGELPAELTRQARWVRLSGDSVQHADVALYRRRFGEGCRLFSSIGAAETGAFATLAIDHQTPLERPLIPVGEPAREMLVELLDDKGAAVRLGEIGEIYVTGTALADGYWREPEMTAARFAPSPSRPGQSRFRTGDFGRVLPDGMLECIGRRDRQLKIRGVTVHPTEVEAVLGGCPGVAHAAVIAQPGGDGRPGLIGCYAGAAELETVRGWIRERLEGAMRPTRILRLDAMPLLPGGKVDLAALAALAAEAEPDPTPVEALAALSPLEDLVRRAWTAWLPAASHAEDATFEAAGGDSLLGLKLVLSLETLLERRLPFGLLDPQTRPSDLARGLTRLGSGAGDDNSRPLLAFFPGMWGGDTGNAEFIRRLEPRFRVIGVDPRLGGDALAGDCDAARYFAAVLATIRAALPAPRLWLVGESFGGKLAAETARQLAQAGVTVEAVVVLDGETGGSHRRERMFARAPKPRPLRVRLREGVATHGGPLRLAVQAALGRWSARAVRRDDPRLQLRLAALARRVGSPETRRLMDRAAIGLVRTRAFGDLPAGRLPAPVRLFVTDDPNHDPARPDLGWQERCERVVRVPIGGTHLTMLRAPVLDVVLERMAELEVALRPAVCAEADGAA
ncbi:MAG TPA: alpha/beta fold hydrolase [Caulobacteraceae bacterium]|nr:alpha/beta fold hydrolase [Caulobacteraceae bacterium]